MVGNEADVIEAFVRHHVRLLDELVLIVHRPVDETKDILSRLQKEGLPLVLRDTRLGAFRQAEETTPVARELLGKHADFVVLLDADEFLRVPDAAYLRRALSALPADFFGAWRWQSYVPLPGDDLREPNPVRRIRHRRREEGMDCFKVVLTRNFLREEFSLLEGNHCVMRSQVDGRGVVAPMMEFKALRLAHFPVRSREQFETKVILGELAKRGAGTGDPALGQHWRKIAETIRDRGGLDAEALCRLAVRYGFPEDSRLDVPAEGLVEDPLAVDFELRYAPAAPRSALQNVLRWLDANGVQPS
jgi:hypothetical protein